MIATPSPARRAAGALESRALVPIARRPIAPAAGPSVATPHDGRSAPAANDLDLVVADRRLLGRARLFGRVVD